MRALKGNGRRIARNSYYSPKKKVRERLDEAARGAWVAHRGRCTKVALQLRPNLGPTLATFHHGGPHAMEAGHKVTRSSHGAEPTPDLGVKGVGETP